MNENKPLNEDILLDRLVDGELKGSERRQLLESFDKRPEGWRRCALTFLEAQSWREEMGQVARGLASDTDEPKLSVPFVAPNPKHWPKAATWLAMAAGLLLAFGLGWMQRDRGPSIAGGAANHPTTQIATVTPPSNPISPNSAKSGDAVTLFVQGDDGRRHPVRVPLVDAATLDKQLGVQFQSGLSDDVRDQLEDSGYAVQSKRQYAPLWLEKENGRPMILPVEDTKIVPVSNKVF
jgi:hypothetical protein